MRKVRDYYEHLLGCGLVLTALSPRSQREPMRKERRATTGMREVDLWLAGGYGIGLALGRWSGYLAVEIKNQQGWLAWSAWSRGEVVKTWEYLHGESYFLVYRIPDGLATRDVGTVYSEQGESRVEGTDEGNIRNHTYTPYSSATLRSERANIVVWGDDHAVPVPRSYSPDQLREPGMMRSFGGIPFAPEFVGRLMEVNTVPRVWPDLSEEVVKWAERNLRPQRNGKIRLSHLYEAYVGELYELGREPQDMRRFYYQLKGLGYKLGRGEVGGRGHNLMVGLEAVPWSSLDRRLRS